MAILSPTETTSAKLSLISELGAVASAAWGANARAGTPILAASVALVVAACAADTDVPEACVDALLGCARALDGSQHVGSVAALASTPSNSPRVRQRGARLLAALCGDARSAHHGVISRYCPAVKALFDALCALEASAKVVLEVCTALESLCRDPTFARNALPL